MRFYALRLHEIGMLKSSPQKLMAQGTDWRFLTALKKELKEYESHVQRCACPDDTRGAGAAAWDNLS